MKQLRIYQDEDGKTQATLAKSERLEDELCDFCSGQDKPFKVYKCRDFAYVSMPQLNSTGEWNACPKCAEYIDANNRGALLARSLRELDPYNHDMTVAVNVKILHDQFFNNREET